MPVAVWDLLPNNPSYSFVGFVSSDKKFDALLNLPQQLVVEPTKIHKTPGPTSASSEEYSRSTVEIKDHHELITLVQQHQVQPQASSEPFLVLQL